jgi:hypothetical protein
VSIRDISGIFSRFFITGFFLPSFFSLFALWISASNDLPPNDLAAHNNQIQILILSGFAVPIGLTILGLRHPVFRFFEGYFFRFRPLERPLLRLQWASRERMAAKKPGSTVTKWKLDRNFPRKKEGEDSPDKSRLLPTRVGNAMLAAEDHAWTRWGLDGIAAWPRIDSLLSEREQELHSNQRSDLYFFFNSALGSIAVGVALIADEIAYRPLSGYWLGVYAIPFLGAYALYRLSIGAVERWGLEMRTSVDLHRLELYEKLGVRRPTSPDDERVIAKAVTRLLLRGERLPSCVWDNPSNCKSKGGATMPKDSTRDASPGEPREEEIPDPAPGEPREDPVGIEEGEASPGEPREDDD